MVGSWRLLNDYFCLLTFTLLSKFLQRACIYLNYNQKTHKTKAKRYIMSTIFVSFFWLFLCKNNIEPCSKFSNNYWLHNKSSSVWGRKIMFRKIHFLFLLDTQPNYYIFILTDSSVGHVSFLANKYLSVIYHLQVPP